MKLVVIMKKSEDYVDNDLNYTNDNENSCDNDNDKNGNYVDNDLSCKNHNESGSDND